MKQGIPLLVIVAALSAYAGEHSYQTGTLQKIDIKDVTSAFSIPTTTGQNVSMLLPLGINYQFQIKSDTVVYVANCLSKNKKNYGSEWVVNDPVKFRVEKDKFFLKKPDKGELRLALMTRLRVLPKSDDAGATQQSVEPLPPFATRQTVPQCR
jgi:predicted metalloprotease